MRLIHIEIDMKIFKDLKYKGIGFVESLIALTVSGIVGIVLMSISAQAIYELRKVDMQDSIAQRAVSTAVILQNIAIEETMSDGDPVLHAAHPSDRCFGFEFDDNGEVKIDTGNKGQNHNGWEARSEFEDNSFIVEDDEREYFSYFCKIGRASCRERV